MRLLAEGKRAQAREQFQEAAATGVFYLPAYDLSLAFLARLEDNRWPAWLPGR
jgi:hypothetical protein